MEIAESTSDLCSRIIAPERVRLGIAFCQGEYFRYETWVNNFPGYESGVGNETLIGMKKCENRGADDSHVLRCAMPRQDLSLTNLDFWELRDVRTR